MIRRRTLKRVLLAIAVAVALFAGTGYLYAQGYLMGFTYNNRELSRNEFLTTYEAGEPLNCINRPTELTRLTGLTQVLECFDTDAAVREYARANGLGS